MEQVKDNIFDNLIENQVICENCSVELNDSSIKFLGKGNIVYFLGGGRDNENVSLEKCKITCKGDNNLIFIKTSKFPLKLVITLGHGCNIYIGKNLWSTTTTYLIANEKSSIHIGDWCLFARDIWMRTSDMHMIYDINTKERLNYNKDIYIGEHVWLGQDVTILKGAVIGSGSVIGLGSLCTSKKTQNVNSIYTGRPASLIRRDITWRHKGTNQVNEE